MARRNSFGHCNVRRLFEKVPGNVVRVPNNHDKHIQLPILGFQSATSQSGYYPTWSSGAESNKANGVVLITINLAAIDNLSPFFLRIPPWR